SATGAGWWRMAGEVAVGVNPWRYIWRATEAGSVESGAVWLPTPASELAEVDIALAPAPELADAPARAARASGPNKSNLSTCRPDTNSGLDPLCPLPEESPSSGDMPAPKK